MVSRIALLVVTGVLTLGLGTASVYAWLAENDEARSAPSSVAAVDQVDYGRQLFQIKGCAACHSGGGASVAPDLTRLPEVAGTRVEGMSAEEYVRVSIAAPDAYVVPGYGYFGTDGFSTGMPTLSLTASEIDALAAYLLSEGE